MTWYILCTDVVFPVIECVPQSTLSNAIWEGRHPIELHYMQKMQHPKWVYCYASNNVYTVGKCHSIHKQRMLASTSGVPMNQILQYSARLWIGLKDLDKVWCVLIVDWWVGICQVNMHSLWLYFYVACLTISDDICCRLDAMQTSGDIINNRRVRSVTWWCLLTCLICGWSRWWSTTRHREV